MASREFRISLLAAAFVVGATGPASAQGGNVSGGSPASTTAAGKTSTTAKAGTSTATSKTASTKDPCPGPGASGCAPGHKKAGRSARSKAPGHGGAVPGQAQQGGR